MTERPLSGKSAIVLGAETPAGSAAALALAEAGVDVACVAATTDATAALAVRSVAKRAAAFGVRAPSQAIDAGIGTGVQVAVKQLLKELGRLDAFVCAADAPLAKPVERIGDAEWAKLVGANLSAAFFAMRAAARELSAGGAIIVVAPSPPGGEHAAAYDATKAGALALVRGMAAELAERGVRVYALVAEGWPADGAEGERLGALVVRLASGTGGEASGRALAFQSG